MLASYQIKRITAFFTGGDEYNYITSVLRLNLQKSQLWGSNGEDLKYFFEIGESYISAKKSGRNVHGMWMRNGFIT